MTAIEGKEEISDTDSGIILHSGKNTTTEYNDTAFTLNSQISIAESILKHNYITDQEIETPLHLFIQEKFHISSFTFF